MNLSHREEQVLRELATTGGTDAEIAARLGMSPQAVQKHVRFLRTYFQVERHGLPLIWRRYVLPQRARAA